MLLLLLLLHQSSTRGFCSYRLYVLVAFQSVGVCSGLSIAGGKGTLRLLRHLGSASLQSSREGSLQFKGRCCVHIIYSAL